MLVTSGLFLKYLSSMNFGIHQMRRRERQDSMHQVTVRDRLFGDFRPIEISNRLFVRKRAVCYRQVIVHQLFIMDSRIELNQRAWQTVQPMIQTSEGVSRGSKVRYYAFAERFDSAIFNWSVQW